MRVYLRDPTWPGLFFYKPHKYLSYEDFKIVVTFLLLCGYFEDNIGILCTYFWGKFLDTFEILLRYFGDIFGKLFEYFWDTFKILLF